LRFEGSHERLTDVTGRRRHNPAKLAAIAAFAAGLTLALAGSAHAAVLTPNGGYLFPDTRVGDTSSAVFTLSLENEQSANLAVGISAIEGFSQTNNCPSTLTAGNTCTITLTFAPTRAGDFSGVLGVGLGEPDTTVRFAGDGVAAPAKKKCKKGKGKKGSAAAKKGCKKGRK
jgi:hypothetical protein